MSESVFEFFFLFTTVLSGVLAVLTVTTKHILRSAVYLMGVLSASAVFYLLLGSDYLAGMQILVYVGGIVVLLVFAVMLTRSDDLVEDNPTLNRKVIAFVASSAFFAITLYLIKTSLQVTDLPQPVPQDSIKSIGRALLDTGANGYVLAFEIISLLLLSVLIAGVVLARKESET